MHEYVETENIRAHTETMGTRRQKLVGRRINKPLLCPHIIFLTLGSEKINKKVD
jgi:hypothetical protein